MALNGIIGQHRGLIKRRMATGKCFFFCVCVCVCVWATRLFVDEFYLSVLLVVVSCGRTEAVYLINPFPP